MDFVMNHPVLAVILAAAAVFVAVLLVRAALFRPKAQVDGDDTPVEFDRDAAVDVVGDYDDHYAVVKVDSGYGLIEKRLIREYTPVLKKMTIYDGRVLLKLIDRQTDDTAFEIIKEFRGGFEAGLWQTLAKLFGNNLKTDYNPEKDDMLLEYIVNLYEKGLL